ncbi:hypothetical protein K1719_038310 [Acacia pycnantha]|nr:hypothetical protein K1719_038310 [Acacia pycnantha]
MAVNPGKQVMESDDRVKHGSWDCHHDIFKHVRNKSRSLHSRKDKLGFFASLSEEFQVHGPLVDPNVALFVGSLYDSVKPQLLHLLEENIPVSTDVCDDEHYGFFLDHLSLDGKSLVLDIPEDGIFAKYEAEGPEDSTLPTATRCESNLDDRTNLISIDTNLNSGAEQLRKQKQPLQRIVDPKVKRRRGSKPEQCLPLSTVVRSNVDFQVKEEDDDDHLPVLKRPLIKQPEPVVNVDHCWHKTKARARKNTAFRDKLMDDLKRPFSEEEYRMLLKQLGGKKPVQSQRVLRSCTKRYDDNTRPPKCFLDYHADLAKRIDSVRHDHPRVLNLLRGYFYWITNLSQEGSFLPWEDATCLEVLPL